MQRKMVSNVLVAFLVILVLNFFLWPMALRQSLINSSTYPPHTFIIRFDPRQMSIDNSNKSSKAMSNIVDAATKIENLLKANKLAFVSGIMRDGIARDEPVMYISSSLVELGIIRIIEGRAKDNNGYLGQYSGPYSVGDKTKHGQITGLAELTWIDSMSLTDAVVLQNVGYSMSKISHYKGVDFYLRSNEQTEVDEVLDLIESYTKANYRAEPLYEAIAHDTYGLENRQIQLQKLAALFLLFCLLLSIYSYLNSEWFNNRGVYRIERTLGRSTQYFIYSWLLNGISFWLYGLLIATLFVIVKVALYSGNISVILQVLLYVALLILFNISLSFLFILPSSKFPLARKNTSKQKSWLNLTIPLLVSFGLVFSISYLYTGTFLRWLDYTSSTKILGVNRIDVVTTPAATEIPSPDICNKIVDITKSCVAFGSSNRDLWPRQASPFIDAIKENDTTSRIDKQDIDKLDIKILEGRMPNINSREAAISKDTLDIIRTFIPTYGIDTNLGLGYKIVGIIETPQIVNNSFIKTSLLSRTFVPYGAPDIPEKFFLSPSGRSGLIIQLKNNTNIKELKSIIRTSADNIEFIQPASYVRFVAKTASKGVVRLSLILLLALFLSTVIFSNYIYILISQKFLELSVWRILGITISKLKANLLWEFVPVPLISGLLASLLASIILYQSGRPTNLVLTAMGFGAVTTFILILLSYFIISYQVNKFRKEEINNLYRRSL